MEPAVFERTDSISVFTFFKNVKTACGSSSFHKDAAVWLFRYFVREPAKAALSFQVTAIIKYH